MRLIILGGPGAGKGTQAEKLCKALSIPGIAIGDILRSAIATGSDLGNKAQSYVEKGELVPDENMIAFIRQRLLVSDVTRGWVLDGYPRTAFQAEELDFLLEELGQKLDAVLYLNVPDSILMSRSLQRSRADDQPEIVARRIELFHQRTIPILEYYERRHRVLAINGDRPPEQIHLDLLTMLS